MPLWGTGDYSGAEVSIPTDQPAGGNVFTYTIWFFTEWAQLFQTTEEGSLN